MGILALSLCFCNAEGLRNVFFILSSVMVSRACSIP
jgi:hypothetical protein